MLRNKKISIIGTGNMGEALVSGLISSASSKPENIICTDVREAKLEDIREIYGVQTTTNNLEAVANSDIVIYAVKPQIMAASYTVIPGNRNHARNGEPPTKPAFHWWKCCYRP